MNERRQRDPGGLRAEMAAWLEGIWLVEEARAAQAGLTGPRPLHLQGEHEQPVPPLAVPRDADVEVMAASSAARLFVRQGAWSGRASNWSVLAERLVDHRQRCIQPRSGVPGHPPSTVAAMSAILQTIIGAVAAIVGGFVGAWWQTRHADDVARSIRHEERQEQALLALFSAASSVLERLGGIRRAAASMPLTSQYQAASQAASELRQRWTADLIAAIRDRAISDAMWTCYNRSGDLLPGGADAMMQYTEDNPGAKAEHFLRDLGEVIQLAVVLRGTALRVIDPRAGSGNPPI
jgi:hypothetical protein